MIYTRVVFMVLMAMFFFWWKKNYFYGNPKGSLSENKNDVVEPTLFDVRHFIIEQEIDTAICLFQDIYQVDYKTACDEVEELRIHIENRFETD